jgi:uncharacterized protein YoxC
MDAFDYRALGFWWDILQTAILTFVAIYTWLVNRTKANRKAINSVNEKVDGLHNRVTVIEHELEHVPGDQAVSGIHKRIDQVGQGVRHLEGEMKQVNHTLHLIQQQMFKSRR